MPTLLAVIEMAEVVIKIKLFDELFKHSELTDEDCLKLGREVNRAVRLRIEKELSLIKLLGSSSA